jgi:hypothetical protein
LNNNASDLPVTAEIPEEIPPINPVNITNNNGESFLITNKATLFAKICSLDVLTNKANKPQKRATPKKTDRKLNILFCGMKYPTNNPTIIIDHQGRNNPKA